MSDSPKQKHTNRLAFEKSPYLLQHQTNPVNWYPWGEEAFGEAKRRNCLVFLSIGYSTCHWCHVMERESFENEQIAELLNQFFVSVKVDREERPDIDHIYMTAIQALTGSGGWPLTVFLTPDGRPVTGGTYFPPEDKWGRPGMTTVLPRMAEMWNKDREGMVHAGEQFEDLLRHHAGVKVPDLPGDAVLQKAFEQLQANFDAVNGGFGSAPKFPRSHDLQLLLRFATRSNQNSAVQMVETTLTHMARGGIYDHLGGGFARYATDEAWQVPHFEKMLYDQAMISRAYLEAFQVTQNPFFAGVARGIMEYVLRDLRGPEGGFYSAEDADSEDEEGRFYVWRPEEIRQILEPQEADLFCRYYGVTEEGNFEHQTSILHVPHDLNDFSGELKIAPEDLERRLCAAREKLFQVRGKRIHPHLDDKVLTAWNGMMTASLAFGSRVLNEAGWYDAAAKNAEFILNRMRVKGRLMRRFRESEVSVPAFQEDYAYLIYGLLELYEAGFDPKWLEHAKALAEEMIELFWDSEGGGFFYTGTDAEKLLMRPKEYYDGAMPAGNSVAASVLLRLSRMLGGNPGFEQKGLETIRSNGEALQRSPMNFTQMLMALDFFLGDGLEIVLAGKLGDPGFEALRRTVNAHYLPQAVILAHLEGDRNSRIAALSAFVAEQGPLKDKAAAYVCRKYACQKPFEDAGQLKSFLAQSGERTAL